ncbi:putative membrane protein [Paenibacillus sp. UNCCL117]|uniref:cytochrome c oxidase assembly protein n=1 Tax=unclassified Paenibacillus TaxID=185978 RepID=UPI00089130EA|nr:MULTISPECIES: cytochrome c oxidase assembly protein [unclassified Paenibacillus]SDD96860.1 putative membrane protein [Paenibacillus sp. cl123]SFW56308.1 putative membrane protein [Paenibacillus sp. UNCCL117]
MGLEPLVAAYGFRAVFSPELILIVLLIGLCYWRYAGGKVSAAGAISFAGGLLLWYLALGGPLNLLGHFWFSMHMLQQSILYLIVPPMLLAGLPSSFYEGVLKLPVIRSIVAVIGNPILALFLFNGAFSFYHIPIIFEAAMSNYTLHNVLHLLLFVTAFGLWWPVYSLVGPYPMSPLKKMGYIFLNGLMLTPACALIIFAREPLYALYAGDTHLLCLPFYSITAEKPPLELSWLTQLADQQLGGVIMKIMQEISYGWVLGAIFFAWFRKERAEDPEDPLLGTVS